MRSIVYNSYAISNLIIIIIIIIQSSPPPVYNTPTYLQYNIFLLIPIVTLAHHTPLQIRFSLDPPTCSDYNLSHIHCPTKEYIATNAYTFVSQYCYNQRFTFLA